MLFTIKKPLERGSSTYLFLKLTWTLKPDEELLREPSWRLVGPGRPRGEGWPSRCCSGCSQTSQWSAPLRPPGSSRSASELRARLRSVGRIGWIQRPLTGLEHNRHLYSRLEQKGWGLAGLLGPAPVLRIFIVTARISEATFFFIFVLFWPPGGWPQERGTGLRLAIFRYLHKIPRFVPSDLGM